MIFIHLFHTGPTIQVCQSISNFRAQQWDSRSKKSIIKFSIGILIFKPYVGQTAWKEWEKGPKCWHWRTTYCELTLFTMGQKWNTNKNWTLQRLHWTNLNWVKLKKWYEGTKAGNLRHKTLKNLRQGTRNMEHWSTEKYHRRNAGDDKQTD